MCTKSPTSAEHCALLTEGPARHGSCFANFHSFKLNSLLSYFSSAFWTGEEGHTVGQANSASCSADLCNGIWWSMAVGKTRLKWPTYFQQTWCLLLVTHMEMMQKVWTHFSICFCLLGKCSSRQQCFGGLHGGDVLAVRYRHGWHGQWGYKGLGGRRWWASRVDLFPQDPALLGSHMV